MIDEFLSMENCHRDGLGCGEISSVAIDQGVEAVSIEV